jgi:hypothetical protein
MGLIFKNIFLAIPFYFLWNWLAPIYFTALPLAYQELPFLHCVGLLLLLAIVRIAVLPTQPIINKFKWKGPNRFKDFIDVN